MTAKHPTRKGEIERRDFLRAAGGALALLGCGNPGLSSTDRYVPPATGAPPTPASSGCAGANRPVGPPPAICPSGLQRGVVVSPPDLSLDWPERARAAGLDTLALTSHFPFDEI